MRLDEEEDPDLLRFVSIALEMRERGLDPPVEEICRGREELVDSVKSAIGLAPRLAGLHGEAQPYDPMADRLLVGRYRLLARLGAGSMGVVYRADDQELGRTVAIKILRSDFLATRDAELRFDREAECLATLRHPSVVTVFDRGITDNGGRFFVMELLEGAPLDDVLEAVGSTGAMRGASGDGSDLARATEELGASAIDEPSYVRQVVRWAADLASGLQAAHDAGIQHRDIKPSNVFIRRDGRAVLLDFGIASGDTGATLQTRGAIGTPAYMAPEQLESGNRPTPALDIYGLTATLYHMITGRPPFAGTVSQVFAGLQRRDPIPAYRWYPGLPRDLQAVLDRGMARDPADRYASMTELAADLRAFLANMPVAARHISRPARWWRQLRRSVAFRAGAAVAAVALAGWVGLWWRSEWIADREDAFGGVWRAVPPTLTLEQPDNRVLEVAAAARVGALLDRAVELARTAVPARLVRAGFRLDHGDRGGAVEDMEAVGRELDSPYGTALAAAYTALPEDAVGVSGLVVGGLPAPAVGVESYVAAFHLLRLRRAREDFATARALLEGEELANYPPAQEILLQMAVDEAGGERDRSLRMTSFVSLYQRAVKLEATIGRPTTSTGNFIGTALAGQEQYREALGPVMDAIELSPDAHGVHINAGTILRRLGALELAADHLRRAIRLRENSHKAYRTLTHVLLEQRDFAAAEAMIVATPFDRMRGGEIIRAVMEGYVAYERAVVALEAGDLERARTIAAEARATFVAARQRGWRKSRFEAAVCGVLIGDDPERAFEELVAALGDDPTNWRRVKTVRLLMPATLDEVEAEAIRGYLAELASHLAPHFEPASSGGSTAGAAQESNTNQERSR